MTYDEVILKISQHKTVSLKPSLSRINALLKSLNYPQNDLKVIHIAGTNGKGSVAAMINAVLLKAGYKTGLFISPYIIDFCERIQLCGRMIEKQALVKNATAVFKAAQQLENNGIQLSQFELITAIAFLYFKENNCDYCILETGLGGRYDATNAVNKPALSVITKISMDHIGILGNSIHKIAYEKAGIIKPHINVLTALQDAEAMEVIKNSAAENHAPLKTVSKSLATQINVSLTKTSFQYENVQYELGLLGEHQVENALLAIESVKALLPTISPFTIAAALKNVCHPARMELIKTEPPVILDGAHNPDGAAALASFLKTIKFKGNIIFGAMKDKNTREIISLLGDSCDFAVTVTVQNNPRAESAENLCELFKACGVRSVAASSYSHALFLSKNKPLLVCGSLYLAADMRHILLQNYKQIKR